MLSFLVILKTWEAVEKWASINHVDNVLIFLTPCEETIWTLSSLLLMSEQVFVLTHIETTFLSTWFFGCPIWSSGHYVCNKAFASFLSLQGRKQLVFQYNLMIYGGRLAAQPNPYDFLATSYISVIWIWDINLGPNRGCACQCQVKMTTSLQWLPR